MRQLLIKILAAAIWTWPNLLRPAWKILRFLLGFCVVALCYVSLWLGGILGLVIGGVIDGFLGTRHNADLLTDDLESGVIKGWREVMPPPTPSYAKDGKGCHNCANNNGWCLYAPSCVRNPAGPDPKFQKIDAHIYRRQGGSDDPRA